MSFHRWATLIAATIILADAIRRYRGTGPSASVALQSLAAFVVMLVWIGASTVNLVGYWAVAEVFEPEALAEEIAVADKTLAQVDRPAHERARASLFRARMIFLAHGRREKVLRADGATERFIPSPEEEEERARSLASLSKAKRGITREATQLGLVSTAMILAVLIGLNWCPVELLRR